MQKRTEVVLNGFTKPDTTFRVRVVVRSNRVKRSVGCIPDPLRRGEVHVALTKINTVCRQVSRT